MSQTETEDTPPSTPTDKTMGGNANGGGGGGGTPPPPPPPPPPPGPYRPIKPKMGGLKKISDSDWIAWVGGKPNQLFTALSKIKPESIEATQYRPQGVSSAAKAAHYRTMGLKDKFKRDNNILLFQKEIMDHLKSHGLDTVTYIKDPTDGAQVVSIVTDHDRFTIKSADAVEKSQIKAYDEYDKGNTRDAVKFLYASLNSELKQQLHENAEPEGTFIHHWMNLMHLTRSASVDRFATIRDRIKRRRISDFAGENVTELASDYLSDYKILQWLPEVLRL